MEPSKTSQYPYVKCDRIIASVGGSKGLLISGAFLLHGVLDLSVSLDSLSLGQGIYKDRYE